MKILLSIKPEHADKIFSGEKRYEYRKKVFRAPNIEKVIVYSTKPVGKIISEFSISKILEDTPDRIWRKTKNHSGISKKFFESYYSQHNSAVAIEIERPTLYDSPKNPNAMFPKFTAPQSFAYIRD